MGGLSSPYQQSRRALFCTCNSHFGLNQELSNPLHAQCTARTLHQTLFPQHSLTVMDRCLETLTHESYISCTVLSVCETSMSPLISDLLSATGPSGAPLRCFSLSCGPTDHRVHTASGDHDFKNFFPCTFHSLLLFFVCIELCSDQKLASIDITDQ